MGIFQKIYDILSRNLRIILIHNLRIILRRNRPKCSRSPHFNDIFCMKCWDKWGSQIHIN